MGQLNNRMRKFMGWDNAEDDQFADDLPETESDQDFDVTPLPTVAPMHHGLEVRSTSEQMRIVTLRPQTFNDVQPLGDNFRNGIPVILNLSEMPEEEVRRVVDFASGLTYGLRGRLEKITGRVFLISPADISTSFSEAPTEQRWLS